MARSDTLFSLRYAVRVLERTSRFWQKADAILKICALLAGSGAIYALASESKPITLVFGIFFAFTQALEFAVRPADRSALALGERSAYAKLLARQAGLSDTDLDAAYQQIVSDDEIIAMESLRKIAYNDVLEERGDSAVHAYPLSFWQRVLAFLA